MLAAWQGEGLPRGAMHPERSLEWWTQQPRPHSALAELGRLGNAEVIVAMAQLIQTVAPAAMTKDVAVALRRFRRSTKASRA